MPLYTYSGERAVQQIKSNPYAIWPNRNGDSNRVEPLAKPNFQPGFNLSRGESIFTIGSCFARNIENALKSRGFDIPAHKVLKQFPEFQQFGPNILNNYGVPSIYNELAWALDPTRTFDPALYVEEISPGKCVDMHLNQALRPASYEEVITRRGAIHGMMREIAHCRVVIITLGLAEVWWDSKTSVYLNTAPRRSLIRKYPRRFELHVLNYAETIRYLQQAFDLLKDHGHAELRLVLTVSPVPLQGTYRDQDVMVANTYSKSVLRAAAEEIVASYDFIDYFPSYESVVLSDRKLAWADDQSHVTQQLIDQNISRMTRAYVHDEDENSEITPDELEAALESTGGLAEEVLQLLDQHRQVTKGSSMLLNRYADACLRLSNLDGAIWAIDNIPTDWQPTRRAILIARLAVEEKRFDDAVQLLIGAESESRKVAQYWRTLFNAYAGLEDMENARTVAGKWIAAFPSSTDPYRNMAKLALTQGDSETAEDMYRQALQKADANTMILIDFVSLLVERGNRDEAREYLPSITPTNRYQENRLEQLRFMIG